MPMHCGWYNSMKRQARSRTMSTNWFTKVQGTREPPECLNPGNAWPSQMSKSWQQPSEEATRRVDGFPVMAPPESHRRRKLQIVRYRNDRSDPWHRRACATSADRLPCDTGGTGHQKWWWEGISEDRLGLLIFSSGGHVSVNRCQYHLSSKIHLNTITHFSPVISLPIQLNSTMTRTTKDNKSNDGVSSKPTKKAPTKRDSTKIPGSNPQKPIYLVVTPPKKKSKFKPAIGSSASVRISLCFFPFCKILTESPLLLSLNFQEGKNYSRHQRKRFSKQISICFHC